MLSRDEARRLLRQALEEFAPRWDVVTDPTEMTIHDPHHWLSGIGTFGAALRERTTGAVKVLGRRAGPEPGATFHRGISGLVLQAYLDGSADPIRRYLHEIGVADGSVRPRRLTASARH